MQPHNTRRHILAGALGFAAATAFAPAGAAPAPGGIERANVRLVRDFIMAMQAPGADFAAILNRYLAPDTAVRWSDSKPIAHGIDAALAQLIASYPKDALFSVAIREVFAHGPLVSTYRIDTITMPGRKPIRAAFAGVHVVRGGKLVEYCDYAVR
jgi:limonene-1,2-epoxide hydrolase